MQRYNKTICRKSKETILNGEYIIRKVVNTMANFIVQFPLKTEKYQEDILDKRFEIGRIIYYWLVNISEKRFMELT